MQKNFSQLEYRRADPADISALIRLGLDSYGTLARYLTPDHLKKLESNLEKRESWEELLDIAKGFVCCSGDMVVGMAFLIPNGHPWDIFKSEWSYIRMVGVHTRFQGHGIAKALTGNCIAEARALGEKVIALHTSEMMPAAMHIYESLGFERMYEIEKRLGMRYWMYHLEL